MNHSARLGDPLTPREDQVLLGLADGMRVTEIADELGLARETVMSHSNTMRAKLGARNAAHAVALGYHRGLLALPPPPITDAMMERYASRLIAA